MSAIVAVHFPNMRELLDEFGSSAVWPWVTVAFVLMAGIVVVALHPYWRGAAAALVSVLGWMMVVRGFLLLAFPAAFMSIANRTIGAETAWRIVFVAFAAVGLYLAYVGWAPRQRRSGAERPRVRPDLPRGCLSTQPQGPAVGLS